MKDKAGKKIERSGKFYVYMVQCAIDTYYTGYTNDVEKRIREHNDSSRGAKYLRGRLPVKLVYVKKYSYYKRAVARERSIKRLSHKQKEDLVRIYGKKQTG